MNKEDILKLVEDEREDVINLCSKLLQIPSENPSGDSTEVSDFIKSYCDDAQELQDLRAGRQVQGAGGLVF